MSILISGASFTSGDGIDQPELFAWPTIFSTLVDQPIINLARSGASVDYIIYTLLNELSYGKYTEVIVAWPPLGRTLMVRRENNFLISGNPTFTNSLYGNSKEYKEYLHYFYKYWTNELFEIKSTLQKIITFQSYLQVNNYKYLFINSDGYYLNNWLTLSSLPFELKRMYLDAFDNMTDEHILKEEYEINQLFNQLDLSSYYDPINFALTSMCKKADVLDAESGHPTISGHEYIAKIIAGLWNRHDI